MWVEGRELHTTYHNFEYSILVTYDISRWHLSWTAPIFGQPGGWRYSNLVGCLGAAISIWLWHGTCRKHGSINFFQGINPQKIFEAIFAHLKLKPLIVRVKHCSHHLHELRFFNTKPPTNCNLSKTLQLILWCRCI